MIEGQGIDWAVALPVMVGGLTLLVVGLVILWKYDNELKEKKDEGK